MVENGPNLSGPRPTQPGNPLPLTNPVVNALLGVAEAIALLNALNFSLVKDLEVQRRAVMADLLQNHEDLGKLANRWEREANKKLAGEGA